MREIPLRGKKGGVALVSDEDYGRLCRFTWHQGSSGYVETTPRVRGRTTSIRMHRLVVEAPEGLEVDHINRNKLDNRRCNLRAVVPAVNRWNTDYRRPNKTGFPGVMWRAKSGRWVARIHAHGRAVNLGTFDTAEAAAEVYRQARMLRDAVGDVPEEARYLTLPADRRAFPRSCSNCGKLSLFLRLGRCEACYTYIYRHGVERPNEGFSRAPQD